MADNTLLATVKCQRQRVQQSSVRVAQSNRDVRDKEICLSHKPRSIRLIPCILYDLPLQMPHWEVARMTLVNRGDMHKLARISAQLDDDHGYLVMSQQ
jgi:hypothetical protein